MERWRGRVAVVTGAGSGNGAAIAYQLQDAGLTVVGLDIHEEKIPGALDAARREAGVRGRPSLGAGRGSTPGRLHSLKCDVTKEEEVINTFKWIKDNVGGVDVLVNNAGRCGDITLTEEGSDVWRGIFELNVLGLSVCTREAVKAMREKGVDDGHIVNICSIAGHIMPPWPGMTMYCASKHAVRVLTEGLRKELVAAKSKIRVTEVSPGIVKTNIASTFTHMTPEEFFSLPYLYPEDVADAVLFALSAPPHVQIHEMIVKHVAEEF